MATIKNRVLFSRARCTLLGVSLLIPALGFADVQVIVQDGIISASDVRGTTTYLVVATPAVEPDKSILWNHEESVNAQPVGNNTTADTNTANTTSTTNTASGLTGTGFGVAPSSSSSSSSTTTAPAPTAALDTAELLTIPDISGMSYIRIAVLLSKKQLAVVCSAPDMYIMKKEGGDPNYNPMYTYVDLIYKSKACPAIVKPDPNAQPSDIGSSLTPFQLMAACTYPDQVLTGIQYIRLLQAGMCHTMPNIVLDNVASFETIAKTVSPLRLMALCSGSSTDTNSIAVHMMGKTRGQAFLNSGVCTKDYTYTAEEYAAYDNSGKTAVCSHPSGFLSNDAYKTASDAGDTVATQAADTANVQYIKCLNAAVSDTKILILPNSKCVAPTAVALDGTASSTALDTYSGALESYKSCIMAERTASSAAAATADDLARQQSEQQLNQKYAQARAEVAAEETAYKADASKADNSITLNVILTPGTSYQTVNIPLNPSFIKLLPSGVTVRGLQATIQATLNNLAVGGYGSELELLIQQGGFKGIADYIMSPGFMQQILNYLTNTTGSFKAYTLDLTINMPGSPYLTISQPEMTNEKYGEQSITAPFDGVLASLRSAAVQNFLTSQTTSVDPITHQLTNDNTATAALYNQIITSQLDPLKMMVAEQMGSLAILSMFTSVTSSYDYSVDIDGLALAIANATQEAAYKNSATASTTVPNPITTVSTATTDMSPEDIHNAVVKKYNDAKQADIDNGMSVIDANFDADSQLADFRKEVLQDEATAKTAQVTSAMKSIEHAQDNIVTAQQTALNTFIKTHTQASLDFYNLETNVANFQAIFGGGFQAIAKIAKDPSSLSWEDVTAIANTGLAITNTVTGGSTDVAGGTSDINTIGKTQAGNIFFKILKFGVESRFGKASNVFNTIQKTQNGLAKLKQVGMDLSYHTRTGPDGKSYIYVPIQGEVGANIPTTPFMGDFITTEAKVASWLPD